MRDHPISRLFNRVDGEASDEFVERLRTQLLAEFDDVVLDPPPQSLAPASTMRATVVAAVAASCA